MNRRGLLVLKRCLNVSGIHTPIESRENPLPKGGPLHISLPLDPTFCEVNVHILHPFLKAGSSPLGILFSDPFPILLFYSLVVALDATILVQPNVFFFLFFNGSHFLCPV